MPIKMEDIQIVLHKERYWKDSTSVTTELDTEISYEDRLKTLNNIVPILFRDYNDLMINKQLNSDLDFIRVIVEERKSKETISALGEQVYEEARETLEIKHPNKFVAIDIETRSIFKVSSDPVELAKEIKKYPLKRFYSRKIGRLSLLT